MVVTFWGGLLVGPKARGERSDSEVPLPWIISGLPVVNGAGFPAHGVMEVALKGGLRIVCQGPWEEVVQEEAGGGDASHCGGPVLVGGVVDHG